MDTLAEAPHSSLSGVARVLVHAGKLGTKAAEALVKAAADRKTSFVSALIAAGSVSAADLAHTLSGVGHVHQVYLEKYADVQPDRRFYLCGWSNMIDEAVANLLVKIGYDRRQIIYELYG